MNVSSAARWLGKMWNATLSLLYPEACQLCGRSRGTPDQGFICCACREEIRFIHQPICQKCGMPFAGEISAEFQCLNCRGRELHFSTARSAVVAAGTMLEIIHRYKYKRALWFERLLGEFLVNQARQELVTTGPWNWIVPVPLHPIKLREREFNQAERLGIFLSRACGIPLHKRLLRRIIPTRTQTLLSRQERLSNLRNAFAMRRGARLDGERLVLVDDVFTTGATTNECARTLIAGGAGEVCVWTVARGV